MPRYDLIKRNRYVNRTFVQTSRGCHQGCTFCAEPLMNGLKVRYRPVEDVIREIENCGCRTISINDADFFAMPERPKEIMRALKGRGIRWQAGVTSKLAQDDRMLELAAASGCTMLSIGFESISRDTLESVHKHVNRPETFAPLVKKVHSYGIMVFGLFMFGFDSDDPSVFQQTARFNIEADFDACAYSVLTPYPGTLTWYEMKKAGRIVSFDWDKYDQANVVYRPAQMSGDELRLGQAAAYETFYSLSSLARRFPLRGKRSRLQWSIYNLFMKRGARHRSRKRDRRTDGAAQRVPMPPILPLKREWRDAVIEASGDFSEIRRDGASPLVAPDHHASGTESLGRQRSKQTRRLPAATRRLHRVDAPSIAAFSPKRTHNERVYYSYASHGDGMWRIPCHLDSQPGLCRRSCRRSVGSRRRPRC